MTDNQEKELFHTLGKLVSGVQEIRQNLQDVQQNVQDVQQNVHQIQRTQNEHTGMLKALDLKIDSVAKQVMENDIRLTARIEAVENAVENIGGGVH